MILKTKTYSLMTLCALCTLTMEAQTGTYDLRLVNKGADCKAGKLNVGVEVKAADTRSVFNMGDANYRFEYNAAHIQSPTLISQDNFTNAKDKNYAPQNLQGSREVGNKGIVSLNTFYTAGNGGVQKVTDKWLSVATIGFDIKDFKNTIELRLRDNKAFPISGMSQVDIIDPNPAEFEYNLKTAQSKGNYANLSFDPRKSCQNSAPFVENTKIRTERSNTNYVNLPIIDLDADDVHTVELVSVKHGKASASVLDQTIEVTYTPDAEYLGNDAVTLKITDKYGNSTTALVQVTISENGILVNNGISPNEDGKNDALVIEGLNNYKKHKLSIYDTRGQEIYVSENYKNDWKGTYNDQLLLNGTYLYILEADDEVIKSYIQIER
jgi:gliding motility-associated-like protein